MIKIGLLKRSLWDDINTMCTTLIGSKKTNL